LKLKTALEFGGVLGDVDGKPSASQRVYFTIFRAKVRKILIFKWILLLEIQQIAEIGFGRKNQLSPQLCSHCQIFKFSNLKI
jgi:hypothetical protein